mmetsp:Transcript_10045/g.27513  ORF Transcript_10045/g.27513 Transcript_10045/m.27513 type:complete len:120 (+) Transcript_10045:670-1029(+)
MCCSDLKDSQRASLHSCCFDGSSEDCHHVGCILDADKTSLTTSFTTPFTLPLHSSPFIAQPHFSCAQEDSRSASTHRSSLNGVGSISADCPSHGGGSQRLGCDAVKHLCVVLACLLVVG